MTTTTLAEAPVLADPGCVDCGWMPEPGAKWPSEGRRAVRWIERFLICAEGDWYGQPIRLRPDQKWFLWKWYEFCPQCGYWHFDEALRGAATGDGKTTFFAAIECLEMFGPPEIAPLSPNIVNAAASFEQADLLFSFAGTMLGGRDQVVKEAPLCGYAEVYDTRIKFADGRPGLMERVAAVAGTNEGGNPTLFVGDELHEWGNIGDRKARVHVVIGKSASKRDMICRVPVRRELDAVGPGRIVKVKAGDGETVYREITRGPGRKIGISTAGFDVDHTLLGVMYKQGKKALEDPASAPRLLFQWFEARKGLDYRKPEHRRIAVRDASSAAGITWNVEKRVREYDNPKVARHEWVRYYANGWVGVAEDSWLVEYPEAWDNCEGTWAADELGRAVLAIDLSLSRDSTAVVKVEDLGGGRVAATAKIWLPRKGQLVPHKDVSAYVLAEIAELTRQERFAGVVYDPALMQQIGEDIEDAGVEPIEFSQEPSFMAPACGGTFDKIIGALIVQDGDEEFGRQVKSAAKRQQERGFTLAKGKSRGKIDAAVALCMGIEALERLPEPVVAANTMW